jgi:hypothetical protein
VENTDRPTAHASTGSVVLIVPTDWTPGRPKELSPEAARALAGELLAAALTVKFGSPAAGAN